MIKYIILVILFVVAINQTPPDIRVTKRQDIAPLVTPSITEIKYATSPSPNPIYLPDNPAGIVSSTSEKNDQLELEKESNLQASSSPAITPSPTPQPSPEVSSLYLYTPTPEVSPGQTPYY